MSSALDQILLIPGIGRRSFNPASLFANNEVGGWYDPSDLSTMFQDVAGTNPVTASGQTVGLHLDKSGNGNHRYQASADSRPQYVEDGALRYLLYDGVDDFMETNAVDFTGTDKMTVVAGLRKLTAIGTASAVIGFGSNPLNDEGSFEIQAPGSVSEYQNSSFGTIRRITTTVSFPAPDSAVISLLGDISGPLIALRRNGSQLSASTGTQGTGNYGSHKLFFGRRAGTSVPANIREHQVIIRGAATDLATIEKAELFVRGKVGITW